MHNGNIKELQRALRVACACADLKAPATADQAAALERAYQLLAQTHPKDLIDALVGLRRSGLNPFQMPIDLQQATREMVNSFEELGRASGRFDERIHGPFRRPSTDL